MSGESKFNSHPQKKTTQTHNACRSFKFKSDGVIYIFSPEAFGYIISISTEVLATFCRGIVIFINDLTPHF